MDKLRILIIGGGPGGYVSAIRAAQLGAQVTLIEKDQIGGTCLNRGCIPTKSLLSDAKLLKTISHSNVFSHLLDESFNPFNQMMQRKDKIVNTIVNGVELLLKSNQIKTIKGNAELVNRKQISVNDSNGARQIIEADRIIIATGSKVSIPKNFSPNGKSIITSDEALQLKSLPLHIVIIGGGYIGVEFATLFNALGVKVTIIELQDCILSGLDDEIIHNIKRNLESNGIGIHTGTKVNSVNDYGDQIRIKLSSPKSDFEVSAEKILLATGRIPNLGADFKKVGIDFNSNGVEVNENMETSAKGVYAIGDVTGGIQLAHVATAEGEIAAENAMGMEFVKNNSLVPLCVFTDPEIASVGMTEKQARLNHPVAIGRFPFRANPTALIHQKTEGFIKVVIDKQTDLVLGVHIFGHEASTLISGVSVLIDQNVKAKKFTKFIQAHPTTPEALKEAFLGTYGKAIHTPKALNSRS